MRIAVKMLTDKTANQLKSSPYDMELELGSFDLGVVLFPASSPCSWDGAV